MRAKKVVIIFLIFFLIGIVSRWLFASKDFTHMDGVLYAIGTFDYSIKDSTPPSPGYFLYILSAKLLNTIFHDSHNSLMALSIIYSGLIAAVLYYFGSLLKSQMAGIVSAILFLTSPLFWYKGINIFGYLNSGFFILLTALLGYKVIIEKKSIIIFWFSVCFSILIGIRPQELVVMLPLYVFILFHMRFKEAMFSVAVFFVTCFLWIIPLVAMSGGIITYLSALKVGSVYLVDDSILSGNLVSKINNHLVRMGQYFEWAYFLGIVPLVYYLGRFFYLPNFVTDKKMQFFGFWILPTVIYNVFIQFGEIGHGMSWGLGLLLILGEAVVVFCEDILKMLSGLFKKTLQVPYVKDATCALALCPIVLVNLFMFFYDFDKEGLDLYSFERYRQFNYVDVVKNNRYLISKVNFIKENFKPENTLIISSGVFSHQVMFRLPKTTVIQPGIIYKKDNFGLFLFNNYKRSYYRPKKEFLIPKGITKLILFDDIFIPYLQDGNKKTHYEVGNSYELLACDVSAGQMIVFDYHSIRIE